MSYNKVMLFVNTFYTEPRSFKRWCIHDSKLLSS